MYFLTRYNYIYVDQKFWIDHEHTIYAVHAIKLSLLTRLLYFDKKNHQHHKT